MKGRRSHVWTPEEDAALCEMVAQGLIPSALRSGSAVAALASWGACRDYV
jgi:hypothetical protein